MQPGCAFLRIIRPRLNESGKLSNASFGCNLPALTIAGEK
jgi:hypothetical protein